MHRERNSPCRTLAMIGITETEIGHSYVRGWVTWELFTGNCNFTGWMEGSIETEIG